MTVLNLNNVVDYYKNMASKETSPAIKEHYKKQAKSFEKMIEQRREKLNSK